MGSAVVPSVVAVAAAAEGAILQVPWGLAGAPCCSGKVSSNEDIMAIANYDPTKEGFPPRSL
jgi:hypothetical protein